jgi:beta-carotene ketolase (CrtO type)
LVPPGSDGETLSGSDGETLYFMTPVTPYDLADGSDWDGFTQTYFDRTLATIERYAAGVTDSMIDTCAVSPVDMSRWTTKGHACHIDMTLAQMGQWRPTPSLSGYETPVDRLWQVSAGSHPLPWSTAGRVARRRGRCCARAAEPRRGLTRPRGYASV